MRKITWRYNHRTDWYSNNNNPNETIKITIRFLSNEIRSDAIDINVFIRNVLVKTNVWSKKITKVLKQN